MSTQSGPVIDADAMEEFRRSMRGAPEKIGEQIQSTAQDAVQFVTEPFQEAAYSQPVALALGIGVVLGWALSTLSKIVP